MLKHPLESSILNLLLSSPALKSTILVFLSTLNLINVPLESTGGKLARQNLAKSKYTSFFNNLIDAGINFNNFSGIILTNLAPIYSPEVNRFPNGDYSANSVFDENYLLTPFYRALRTFFRTLITIPE
jgi:hypothetical protein